LVGQRFSQWNGKGSISYTDVSTYTVIRILGGAFECQIRHEAFLPVGHDGHAP
jgi:hypothetical protein